MLDPSLLPLANNTRRWRWRQQIPGQPGAGHPDHPTGKPQEKAELKWLSTCQTRSRTADPDDTTFRKAFSSACLTGGMALNRHEGCLHTTHFPGPSRATAECCHLVRPPAEPTHSFPPSHPFPTFFSLLQAAKVTQQLVRRFVRPIPFPACLACLA